MTELTTIKETDFSDLLENLVEDYLRRHPSIDYIEIGRQQDNRFGNSYSGDGGHDFKIKLKGRLGEKVSSPVFGETLIPGGEYFVEVKYSKNPIDFERTSSNLSRMQNEDGNGVLLVTNSYVRTTAYFDILNSYPKFDKNIYVIDGDSFHYHLQVSNINFPRNLKIISPKKNKSYGELSISEYTKSCRLNGEDAYLFYLVFYNKSEKEIQLDLFSQVDETWEFTDAQDINAQTLDSTTLYSDFRKGIIIPGRCSRAMRLCGRVLGNKVKSAARLAIQHGDHIYPFLRTYSPLEIDFQAPLTGSENIALKIKLEKFMGYFCDGRNKQATNLHIVVINGAAGVGKSRVIEEILPPRELGNVLVLHHTIDKEKSKKGNREKYTTVHKLIKNRINKTDVSSLQKVDEIASEVQLIEFLLNDFQRSTTLGSWGGVICVLEDLHNASTALCEKLNDILGRVSKLNLNVVMLFSARNDDSFFNKSFREFEGKLIESSMILSDFLDSFIDIDNVNVGKPKVIVEELKELKTDEAKQLVATSIEGIHPAGIERILKLSGTVPHHIIQSIEYLLDETLLAIDSRSTLSIIDLYVFEKRSTALPDGINELFSQRFMNLVNWRYGEAAIDAILTAILFGTHFPQNICGYNHGLNSKQKGELIKGLIARKFFKKSEEVGQLQWSHENLEIFFEKLRRSYIQNVDEEYKKNEIAVLFKRNAYSIYNTKLIFENLPELVKGDVAVINSDFKTAVKIFNGIIKIAESTNHFVSIDLNTDYYHHIESVVNIIIADGYPDNNGLLWKLLCLKTYVGAFHLGLGFSLIAFDYANKILDKYELNENDKILSKIWLESIYAHIHMDSGFIGLALEKFLYLHSVVKLDLIDEPELEHEINNCLRLIYIYTNFDELAKIHGKLSSEALKKSKSKHIANVDLGDEGFMYSLQDRSRSLNLLFKSIKLLNEQGEIRHNWHTQIGLIAYSAPDHQADIDWLNNNIAKCWEIIKQCRIQKYHSILPRTYLLIAVLEYLCSCSNQSKDSCNFSKSLHYANEGLNATEAYSIGFTAFQLHNLIAVIEARNGRLQIARKHIETAIEKLKKEGLTFIGNGKLISAIPIVYGNYIKIIREAGKESQIKYFLGSLHGFKDYGWHKEELRSRIMRHVDEFHHIILDYKKQPDYFYLDSETNLAVVAWH